MIYTVLVAGSILRTNQHFASLDGLRGIAAAAVVFRHLSEDFGLPQVVGHGYLAVDFFFILSGFVICWAYERRLATGWSNVEFIRVRLIRLLPLIALGSILGGVLTGLERKPLDHVAEATLLSVLCLPFPWRGVLFPVNGPLWSMFYELVSNVVYAVARPRLGPRVLLFATAIAAAAVIFVAARVGNLDAGFLIHRGWAGGPRLAFPFLAGVLIYRLYIRGSAAPSRAPAWMLVVGLVAVLAMPKVTGHGAAALDIFFSLVVLPALVWFGVRASVGPRVARLCALSGELSYPVYVLHRPIEIAMGHLAQHLASPSRMAAALGCVVIIFSLAFLASHRYDLPLRRVLMKFTAPKPRADASALAAQSVAFKMKRLSP